MARRSKAREVALQMLYQIDVNPDVDAQAVRDMIAEQLPDEELRAFTWRLFVGVRDAGRSSMTGFSRSRKLTWHAWPRRSERHSHRRVRAALYRRRTRGH
jgi:hypothetical protein